MVGTVFGDVHQTPHAIRVSIGVRVALVGSVVVSTPNHCVGISVPMCGLGVVAFGSYYQASVYQRRIDIASACSLVNASGAGHIGIYYVVPLVRLELLLLALVEVECGLQRSDFRVEVGTQRLVVVIVGSFVEGDDYVVVLVARYVAVLVVIAEFADVALHFRDKVLKRFRVGCHVEHDLRCR